MPSLIRKKFNRIIELYLIYTVLKMKRNVYFYVKNIFP